MFDWKTWFPNPAGTPLESILETPWESLLETRHSQNLHLCILLRKERPAKKHSLPKNTRSYNKTLIWSWLFLGDCWAHLQCTIVHCVHEKCICATFCVHCLAKAHFSDQWIYLPNCDTCLRVRCQNINPIHTFGLFLLPYVLCVNININITWKVPRCSVGRGD